MINRLLLLTFLLIKVESHTGTNSSDVIVIDTGHAEAGESRSVKPRPSIGVRKEVPVFSSTTTEQFVLDDEKEDVVFVPNEREVVRNYEEDNYFHDEQVKIKDVLANRKTVNEILNPRNVHLETEAPPDILFISGKNNENAENEKPAKKQKEKHKDARKNNVDGDIDKNKNGALNCSNLECNNTLKSLCGGKMEHKQWKYRLFLNDCYFRKVNCGFKYEENRYIQVPAENCINIAGHYSERPYFFKPLPPTIVKPDMIETVRNASARRSLHIGLDGTRCTHPCPLQCTNDYQPECAVTPTGERRVFINHCKLDYNSCFNGILWRRRPMSECVGGKKADMQQNRAFINWMQRVGIVDNKGRLVLS